MDIWKNFAVEAYFWLNRPVICREETDAGQAGFWDINERNVRLNEAGDPLEKLNALAPLDVFCEPLAKALKRSDGAKGDRPALRPGAGRHY